MRAIRTFMLTVLIPLLMVGVTYGQDTNGQETEKDDPLTFSAPTSQAVWKTMVSDHQELPVWARTFSGSLPRTTAAMLRLDDLHRRHNPLGNRLANLVRWKVALTLDCPYALAYARYDLENSGLSTDQIDKLDSEDQQWSTEQQHCLALAEKLTRAGYTVTDQEMDTIREELGNAGAVALVQTIAFANFQYRLFFAIGADVEDNGPLPSCAPPGPTADQVNLPKRRSWDDLYLAIPGHEYEPPQEFTQDTVLGLQPKLAEQKARTARIPFPDQDQIDRLDEESQQSANRIRWSRVAYGYQPEMTRAWFHCLRAYQQEAKPEEIFLNSVFWVVTRSNECFY